MPHTDLPVEAVVGELAQALGEVGSAVLQAEPGAGKTTVVPLRLLNAPWLGGQRIVMLEPRRLAARASAKRMAELLGEAPGETVGYRTRDESVVGPRTRIEVVTDGILVRRLQNDPELDGVGLVIFDEFHERSLVGDLALAFALESRAALAPDQRVLVMSATIDTAAVAELLATDRVVPIVTSVGRQFPVDVSYLPTEPGNRVEADVAAGVLRALTDTEGDVLVFLPGAAAIGRAAQAVSTTVRQHGLNVDVRRLFGALPAAEQDAALAPSPPGRRKVVLATDIAETSLTVVGVTAVVDSGLVRQPRFDPRRGMTRLVTTSVSVASADQRSGRAGRLGPGAAYRLWSRADHATRPAFTAPEIAGVDLAGLALELAAWGVEDPADLALSDLPPPGVLAESRQLLEALGALDPPDAQAGVGRITDTGRAMIRLPLHPRLARMVVDGAEIGHGWLAAIMAALLDERDVLRGRPEEIPTDLGLRVELVLDNDGRTGNVARRARQIAKRARVEVPKRSGKSGVDLSSVGRVLALGYPDRIAQRRAPTDPSASPRSGAAPARFRLRSGTGAELGASDALTGESWLVVADIDDGRDGVGGDSRIRIAAPFDLDSLVADASRLGTEVVVESDDLVWDSQRNDLRARSQRRIGALVLASQDRTPKPGPEVVDALVDRVRDVGLDLLNWSKGDRSFQQRLCFAHRHFLAPNRGSAESGGVETGWPDSSDEALLGDLDAWLTPFLSGATSRKDLEAVPITVALRARLAHDYQRSLDRWLPAEFALPAGNRRLVYEADRVVLSTRAQDLYGLTQHPAIAQGAPGVGPDGIAISVQLLSPAQRPIQITSDLPGFWAGSWSEVRKDMAGRYPKHDWPLHPGGGS